jgi:serine/threonine protein kinase/Tfp pilus assembly protein PilF
MSQPKRPLRDDPTAQIFGEWSLGGDGRTGSSHADDSLFFPPPVTPVASPPPPATPATPGPGTGTGPDTATGPVPIAAGGILPARRRNLSRFKRAAFVKKPDPVALPSLDFNLEPAGGRPSDGPDSLVARAVNDGARTPLLPASSGPPVPQAEPKPPKPGDVLSGFRLVSELGRGAFARVFLAEQVELGGRRVALKVSKAEGDEPQMLARLQHAHIVPILSLHDDPVTGLRIICMPYLGGANLAQVLEAAGRPSMAESNRLSLVDALDEVSQRLQKSGVPQLGFRGVGFPDSEPGVQATGLFLPERSLPGGGGRGESAPGQGSLSGSINGASCSRIQSLWNRLSRKSPSSSNWGANLDDRDFDQPARQFLRHAKTTEAAVWITARLAEGLEHAHSRGLLHRDLKPSNILIAGDGTPMLLDFNLSSTSEPDSEAEGEKALLGGTLPYMSPEHLDAFHPDGNTSSRAVDERSDVYSLGLILFEMIAGDHPFPDPPADTPMLEVIACLAVQRKDPPSLRSVNPSVPWSLDSVLKKCLAPEPNRRYARARDLAEDLCRFLEDLPLRHAPEPSPRERLGKWARRNPRLCSASAIASLAAVLILSLGALIGLLSHNMQNLSARLKLQVFRSDLNECRFLLNLAGSPASHFGQGLVLAEKMIDQQAISGSGDLRRDSWVQRLTRAEQSQVRQETVELILLAARAKVAMAGRKDVSEVRRTEALEWAVRWLDRAERLDSNPPAALHADRARYLSALGRADLAARDRMAEARKVPVTARDFTLLGSARLARGEVAAAETALLRSIDLDPRSFWAWFALGHCRLEQGRDLDAVGDFSACVALEPRFAWPHLNRGIALARAGRLEEARRSYRSALSCNSRFAEAWINLGLVDLELNDLADAELAISKALKLGRNEAGVLAALAEVKARRGDRDGASRMFDQLLGARPDDVVLLTARGIFLVNNDPQAARADFDRVVKLDPRNARAHYGLALLLRNGSPREALEHVEIALNAERNLLDALQLRALLRARLGDLAAVDDVERLCRTPTPYRLYNASCALALLVETAHEPRFASRAVSLLDGALEVGFPAAHAAADPDLRTLHAREDFRDTLKKPRKIASVEIK